MFKLVELRDSIIPEPGDLIIDSKNPYVLINFLVVATRIMNSGIHVSFIRYDKKICSIRW